MSKDCRIRFDHPESHTMGHYYYCRWSSFGTIGGRSPSAFLDFPAPCVRTCSTARGMSRGPRRSTVCHVQHNKLILLADEPVQGEPVSGEDSLLSGKRTGNFRYYGANATNLNGSSAYLNAEVDSA